MASLYVVLGILVLACIGIGAGLGAFVAPMGRRASLINRFFRKRMGIVAIGWPSGIKEYLADYSKPAFEFLNYIFLLNPEHQVRKDGVLWTYFDPKDCLPPELLAVEAKSTAPDGKETWVPFAGDTEFHICLPKHMVFEAPKAEQLGRDPLYLSAFNSKQKITAEAGAAKRQKMIFWLVAACAALIALSIVFQYLITMDLGTLKSVTESGHAAIKAACLQVPAITPPAT